MSGGRAPVRKLKRAQILLAASAGETDEAIAVDIAVGTSTVYRTKRRFVEEGLEEALREEPRPGAERKLSMSEEALLIATACTKPPTGRSRWTCELLADEMVRLTKHDSLSPETVRRRLAEKELKPWQKKMWCIPKVDADFVARMEDVLELYAVLQKQAHPMPDYPPLHHLQRSLKVDRTPAGAMAPSCARPVRPLAKLLGEGIQNELAKNQRQGEALNFE